MKTTTTTILTSAALMLALGLTGCASTEMQQQEVPSATSTPSASSSATPDAEETTEDATEAPAEDTPWVEPTFDAVIPENVTAAYADSVSTLEEQGEALVSLTQTQMTDLQAAREGDEALFYEPLREHLSGTAWENVMGYVSDESQHERLDALVPQADRSGSYGEFGGVEYTAIEGGIYAYPVTEPLVGIGDGGVTWEQEIRYEVYASPENLTYSSILTLSLQPGPDGTWLIDGWNASPTSEIVVSN